MAVVKKAKRQYLTISEIQDEYLPISKKKIRNFSEKVPSDKDAGQ